MHTALYQWNESERQTLIKQRTNKYAANQSLLDP